jgi:hypothetical protein
MALDRGKVRRTDGQPVERKGWAVRVLDRYLGATLATSFEMGDAEAYRRYSSGIEGVGTMSTKLVRMLETWRWRLLRLVAGWKDLGGASASWRLLPHAAGDPRLRAKDRDGHMVAGRKKYYAMPFTFHVPDASRKRAL